MFRGHVWTHVVLLCTIVPFATSIAVAQQDDPFGDPGPEAVADPAVVPRERTLHEKPESPLDVELPVIEAGEDQDFCRCIGESDAAAVARIEKILDSPLKTHGLEFTETPFEEVLNLLQDEYGIPIQLDEPALEANGLDASEPVTVNLHNISLRSALRLMLKKLQLTHIIRDEVLLITTPAEADSQLLTCVYDVRNLLDKLPMTMSAGAGAPDYDSLVDAIESCIATKTWKENGGTLADMRPLGPGFLVIAQTRAVHDEVSSLLTAIREMRGKNVNQANNPDAALLPDANGVITRSFILQVQQEGDGEKLGNQLREFILQSLPDEQWEGQLDSGQAAMLMIFPDRIVVRHKPHVLEKVQRLLVDSAIATPATTGDPNMGRMSGRGGGAGMGYFEGTEGGGGFFAPKTGPPRSNESPR